MYEGIKILNGGQVVNIENLQKSVDGEHILYGVSSLKVLLTNGALYNENVEILENNSDVKIFLIDSNGEEVVIILRGLGEMLLTNNTEVPVFEVFQGTESEAIASMTTIDDLEAAAAGGETTSEETANPPGAGDLLGTNSPAIADRLPGLPSPEPGDPLTPTYDVDEPDPGSSPIIGSDQLSSQSDKEVFTQLSSTGSLGLDYGTDGASLTNAFSIDYNEGLGTATIVSLNGVTTITSDSWILTIDENTGAYEFKQTSAYSHTENSNSDEGIVTVTITDIDGDSVSSDLVLKIEDDSPIVSVSDGAVDESALSDGSNPSSTAETTTGTFTIDSGNDGLQSLTVGGVDVTSGGTVSGTYGTLTVINTAGVYTWSYTLDDNTLDHTTQGANIDGIQDDFSVVVTDSDGDNSPADTLTVTIKDDVPSIELQSGGDYQQEDYYYSMLEVDESDLSYDDSTNFSGMFTSIINAGADGQASLTSNYELGISSVGANSGLIDSATGEDVLLRINASGDVEGYSTTGGIVFVIGVTSTSGEMTLDQQRAVKHYNPNYDNESVNLIYDSVTLTRTDTIIDGDGDIATDSETINIGYNIIFRDDVPTANNDDMGTLAEDTATAVDVKVNDVEGADGVDWTDGSKVYYNGDATKGTVVYNNDGTFTYTPTAGEEGTDSFTYTIKDADGDTSTATVSLTLAPDSKPTINPENAIIQNITGNVVGDVAVLDLNMDYGADGAGSVILNPEMSTDVSTFGYAVDTLGNLLTSTVSGTTYNIVYIKDGNSILAVHYDNSLLSIDPISGYAILDSGTINDLYKVFTIAPDYSGTGKYTISIDGILDGGATIINDVISTQNVSTQGGNSDTRSFVIDGDGNPQTTDDILEVDAYGNLLLFDFPNGNYTISNIIVGGTSYSIGDEVTITLAYTYNGNTVSGDVTLIFYNDGTYKLVEMDRFDWPVDGSGDYVHGIKAKPTVNIEYVVGSTTSLLYDSTDPSDNGVYMEFGTTNYTNNDLGVSNTSINTEEVLTLDFSQDLQSGTTFTLSGNGSSEADVVLYYNGVALDPTKYDTSYFDSVTNKYHIIVEDNLVFDRVDFFQDGTIASGYSLTSMNAIVSYESQGTPFAIDVEATILDSDGDQSSSHFAVVFDNNGIINDNGVLTLKNTDDDIDSWDIVNILNGASSDTSLLDDDITSIDLSNGNHILSNLSIDNFISLAGTGNNSLTIEGESGDQIYLDMTKWEAKAPDSIDTNTGIDTDGNSDGYVTYTNKVASSGGVTAGTLELLIDEDIDIKI